MTNSLPLLTPPPRVAEHTRLVMRTRLGGILAFASLLFGTVGACNTAGVAYVYMAIDSAGTQHRQEFYTDSNSIYCVAVMSSGRPDVTLDFTISQHSVNPWCDPTNVDTKDAHPVFAVGEQVPGVGVETVVAEQLLATGIQPTVPCSGYCTQNLPTDGDDLCSAAGATGSGSCRDTYISEGPDSCGLGATCCQQTIVEVNGSGSMSSSPISLIPYPAGEYDCTVRLDGVVAGITTFSVVYPPTSCPVPPPAQNIPCYNWVPKDAVCNGPDVDSKCKCEATGVWNCASQ